MIGLNVAIMAKSFGGRSILGDLAFSLAPGEVACLLGPSGCGKTTLLSLIAGLDDDFEGTIERPDGRIAMVFQAPRLLPWRTLTENIALIPGAGGTQAARDKLAEVGLAEAADAYPEKVSLGMQRRAALARALAIEPGLILMDEPLVSLDPDNAIAMRLLIGDLLTRSGAAALIATHDRREALALADRILELGGTPATLIRDRSSPLIAGERSDADAVEAVYREWFGSNDAQQEGAAEQA